MTFLSKQEREKLRDNIAKSKREIVHFEFHTIDDDTVLACIDHIDALEHENADLRRLKERIYNPEIMEGYQPVRRKLLFDAYMLMDPAPVEHDGKTMVFKNPMAAEILTRLSAILREMTTPEPEPTYEQALAIASAPEVKA